jgi:lipoprotein-anchoring transpeptidase ErfK/SrfK
MPRPSPRLCLLLALLAAAPASAFAQSLVPAGSTRLVPGANPALQPKPETSPAPTTLHAPPPPIATETPLPPSSPPAVEPSGLVAPKLNKQIRINLAWQIALDAADFSPGIIDGHFRRRGLLALSEYAARFFPGSSPFDVKVYDALKVDVPGAVTEYPITEDDAAQVAPLPEDWNDKAKLDRLRYETLAECMGEKFHCTVALLQQLNPALPMTSLAAGQTLLVPNIRPFPVDNKPVVLHHWADTASVTVNLGEKTIRVFDKEGAEIALFQCSIAKDKAKLPTRDAVVQIIAAPNPQYTFHPEMYPEVKDVTQTLQIPPGPRNPVGLAWVGLDLPGYGIHGTPKPELIGKTGSHGCFRLTNWDALKFAGFVQIGIPVKIVNPPAPE